MDNKKYDEFLKELQTKLPGLQINMLRFDPKNIEHIEDVEKIFLDLQSNELQNNKIQYKKRFKYQCKWIW